MNCVEHPRKYLVLLLIVIILMSGSLRLYNLGRYSLWYDEAGSIILARHISTIYKQVGTSAPLFFFLLYFWLNLGESEFVLRLLPAIFGIAGIPLFFLLARRLVGDRTSVYATLLLAFSPFHVYYAQELRGYTLLPLFFMACSFFFIRALNDGRTYDWFLFSAFGALSLYTHYFAVFSLFANFLYFFLYLKEYRGKVRNFILYNLLILLFFAPWLYFFLEKAMAFQRFSQFWILRPGLKDLVITVKNFIIGYGAPKWAFYLSTFLGVILLLKATSSVFRSKNGLFVFLHTFVPVVLTFAYSRFSSNSIYLDRCMIISSTFFLMLIAMGLSSFQKRWVMVPIFLILIFDSGVSIFNLYNNRIPRLDHNYGVRPRKEFKQAALYIKRNLEEGDLIGHTCRSSLPVFMVYVPECENISLATNYGQINYIKRKYPYQEIWETPLGRKTLPHLIEDAVRGKKRLWLVYGQWDLGTKGFYYQTSEEIKNRLMDEFNLLSVKEFYGIPIYLFSLDKNSNQP